MAHPRVGRELGFLAGSRARRLEDPEASNAASRTTRRLWVPTQHLCNSRKRLGAEPGLRPAAGRAGPEAVRGRGTSGAPHGGAGACSPGGGRGLGRPSCGVDGPAGIRALQGRSGGFARPGGGIPGFGGRRYGTVHTEGSWSCRRWSDTPLPPLLRILMKRIAGSSPKRSGIPIENDRAFRSKRIASEGGDGRIGPDSANPAEEARGSSARRRRESGHGQRMRTMRSHECGNGIVLPGGSRKEADAIPEARGVIPLRPRGAEEPATVGSGRAPWQPSAGSTGLPRGRRRSDSRPSGVLRECPPDATASSRP